MPNDWSKYQDEIQKLYLHDRKPLREVRRLIQGRYGFKASTRAYRIKLEKWGFKKADNADSGAIAALADFTSLAAFLDQSSVQAEISTSLQQQSSPHILNSVNYPLTRSHPSLTFPINPESSWPNQPVPNINQTEYLASSANHDSAPASYLRDKAGRTNLMKAVLFGNVDYVRSLLLDGAAVHAQDNFGDRALHISCRNPGISNEILSLLMDYGARSDAIGRDGKTPLHLSANSSSRLKILLKGKPDLSVQDDNGNTPLHYACGLLAANEPFELLVKNGADLNIPNHARQSPFEKLLEVMNNEEKSPLLLMSLRHGADVTLRDSWGRLPFETFAALCPQDWPDTALGSEKRWVEGAHLFLMKGASPNIKVRSENPLLHELIKYDNFWLQWKEFGYIVCGKTDPHIRGIGGSTSLHEIAKSVNPCEGLGLLALLIKLGADVNALNDEGQSPLVKFVERYRAKPTEITEKAMIALLDAGANPFCTITSMDMPIYTLAKSSVDISIYALAVESYLAGAMRVLKLMLRFATSWESSFPARTTEIRWWRTFAKTFGQARHCEEIQMTSLDLDPSDCLPEDVIKNIGTAADQVIAEEALTALKKELLRIRAAEIPAPEKLRDICRKIVYILRVCRDKPIKMDVVWYQLLLDTTEFG